MDTGPDRTSAARGLVALLVGYLVLEGLACGVKIDGVQHATGISGPIVLVLVELALGLLGAWLTVSVHQRVQHFSLEHQRLYKVVRGIAGVVFLGNALFACAVLLMIAGILRD
jgi:hypothetical protein